MNGNNHKDNADDIEKVKKQLTGFFDDLYLHDGFGRLEVDMKILKKRQKEIILRYGKEHRFVVDWYPDN